MLSTHYYTDDTHVTVASSASARTIYKGSLCAATRVHTTPCIRTVTTEHFCIVVSFIQCYSSVRPMNSRSVVTVERTRERYGRQEAKQCGCQ